jgi:cell division protein FtsL
MTFDQLLQWTIALVSAALGYAIRELWGATQKLRQDISDLESKLPTQYVQKDDYKADIGRIMDQLDRIYNKLDKKVDR